MKTLYYKVTEGLYVGNTAAAADVAFIRGEGITAIINFGKALPAPGVDVSYQMLPNQELMEQEYAKTLSKLDSLVLDIQVLRAHHRNVLICCPDGKNKCMLMAGYYLIAGGARPDETIKQLETAYFSAQQRLEDSDDTLTDTAPDKVALRAERREIRGLTMSSFRRLLYISASTART